MFPFVSCISWLNLSAFRFPLFGRGGDDDAEGAIVEARGVVTGVRPGFHSDNDAVGVRFERGCNRR